MDSKRVFIAAAVAALPSAFSLLVYVGPLWIAAGYLLGLCLWGLVVAPLSIALKRSDFFFAASVCMFFAFAIGCWYVESHWVPGNYASASGTKTLVQKGVATEAYYVDLLTSVLWVYVGLVVGAPLFSLFARGSNNKAQ